MDRNSTIGFILIAVVLVLWIWLSAPQPGQRPMSGIDTTTHVGRSGGEDTSHPKPSAVATPQSRPVQEDTLGKWFASAATGQEKITIIETDLYTAEISTKGGLVRKWELKKYTRWDGLPVQLVDMGKHGDFSAVFTSADGKLINTKDLYFTTLLDNWKRITLKNGEEYRLDLALNVGKDSSRIVKTFTFKNGLYSFDAGLRLQNMESVIAGFEYQVVWEHSLNLTENNSIDEASFAAAHALIGGELVDVDATGYNEEYKKNPTGSTDWVASRNKYFAVALVPRGSKGEGAYLEGSKEHLPNGGERENYAIGLKMPFKGAKVEESSYTVFLGPLNYDVVKSYDIGLERIMSLGWAIIVRPIGEYFMLPLFKLIHSIIPNWGLVIIIFSLLIKVLLYPLSITQMRSMKKMQAIQPMVTELRQKHKDDPTKMNKEMMRIYKEYGVNPASGCLPMLLQMPILYALWALFRQAIELRQASFIWWIKDLSIPDSIYTFSFSVPLLGNQVSGLALLMGATMLIQQMMTVKDPRQKTMVYMMPIMFTLLFSSFPSGLNLYYFMFNLFSIGQQLYVNKYGKEVRLEKVETRSRPKGIFSRIEIPKNLRKGR
jgi:YidC/Oxa1 family membrane protein insertase